MSKKVKKQYFKAVSQHLTGNYGTINDEYLNLSAPVAIQTLSPLTGLGAIQQKEIAMQNASSGLPGAATEPTEAATTVMPPSTATVPVAAGGTPATGGSVAASVAPAAAAAPAQIQPPVANAGQEQDVTLPNNGIILDGSASYDPQGQTLVYNWSVLSGPNTPVEQPDSPSAIGVAGLEVGIYVFQLTVTNQSGLSSSAQVTVNVSDASGGASGEVSTGGGAGTSDTTTATTAATTTGGSALNIILIIAALIAGAFLFIKDKD